MHYKLSTRDGSVYLVSVDPFDTYKVTLPDMIKHDELPGLTEAGSFTDEENSLFSLAEIAEGRRTQHQTCLCFQGRAETKPDFLQLCLLPFKAFSGMIQRKGTAENKLMILGNRP